MSTTSDDSLFAFGRPASAVSLLLLGMHAKDNNIARSLQEDNTTAAYISIP